MDEILVECADVEEVVGEDKCPEVFVSFLIETKTSRHYKSETNMIFTSPSFPFPLVIIYSHAHFCCMLISSIRLYYILIREPSSLFFTFASMLFFLLTLSAMKGKINSLEFISFPFFLLALFTNGRIRAKTKKMQK